MSGEGKQVKVKYKRIRLSDLQFDQGDNFFERGQFGDVKRAKWSDKVVAVKCFSSADRKGGFSEELVCLSLLQKHKHIVEMYGAWVSEHPFIVLEFAPISLEKVLHECKKKFRYTADHVMSWTYQMAVALEYIHSKDMLHRDIKPSNVLLFEQGQLLKLCDFGTAKKLEHTLTNAVGTIRYMAPEVIRGRYYTPRCDVFSFGIVVWEMITRKRPILGSTAQQSNMAILYAMANGARPPQIRDLPKAISQMMDKCLNEEPQNRPPMDEIKAKVGKLCEFVEMNKPLIPRRQAKQQKQPSTETTLLAALQNMDPGKKTTTPPPSKAAVQPATATNTSPPEARGGGGGGGGGSQGNAAGSKDPIADNRTAQVDPPDRRVSNAEPRAEEDRRGRTFTAPEQSLATESHIQHPDVERNKYSYYKQLSSPPTDRPSELVQYHGGGGVGGGAMGGAHYPPLHPTLGQSSSYPANVIAGSGGVAPPGVGGERWGYRHQASDYGVMMTDIHGEQSLATQQLERYQQFEQNMKQKDLGDIAGLSRAVVGQSSYAIPALQPEYQPVIPDENNPESMELYRQYRAVAEQVLQAKRELGELQDECSKLDKETREDHQKLELNKSILQEYQARSNEKDRLMGDVQELTATLNQLRVQNAKFQTSP